MTGLRDDILPRIEALETSMEGLGHQLGLALKYRDSDPHGALGKCRGVLESLLIDIHRREAGEPPERAGLLDLIRSRAIHKTVPRRVMTRMQTVRDLGNVGSHLGEVNDADATLALGCMSEVIGWYLKRYGAAGVAAGVEGEDQARGVPQPKVAGFPPSPIGTLSGRGFWLIALGLVVVGGVVAVALLRSSAGDEDSKTPPAGLEATGHADSGGPCPTTRHLTGVWRFKTVVLSAGKRGAKGTRGYYRMMITADGCEVRATVSKLGYNNKRFAPAQEQTGSALLELPPGGSKLVQARASFVLRNSAKNALDTHFDFVFDGDRLHGYWRHEGDEWERRQLRGVLGGRRGSEDVVGPKSVRGQPCVVRCRLACDGELRDDSKPLASCLSRCARHPWLVPESCED